MTYDMVKIKTCLPAHTNQTEIIIMNPSIESDLSPLPVTQFRVCISHMVQFLWSDASGVSPDLGCVVIFPIMANTPHRVSRLLIVKICFPIITNMLQDTVCDINGIPAQKLRTAVWSTVLVGARVFGESLLGLGHTAQSLGVRARGACNYGW